jgi:hypothetical protein
MSKRNNSGRSSLETMLAAKRFSRRTMLKAGAAAGAITAPGNGRRRLRPVPAHP